MTRPRRAPDPPTVRQARGYRLGAMQRKFPALGARGAAVCCCSFLPCPGLTAPAPVSLAGIGLLYLLAMIELLAFPLLGAGSAGSASILTLQSILFAFLCGAHVLVLRIIQELWQASGGVFNVDEVLQQMVFGLEEAPHPYLRSHAHTRTHTHAHASTHVRTHAHAHARALARTHARARAHTT